MSAWGVVALAVYVAGAVMVVVMDALKAKPSIDPVDAIGAAIFWPIIAGVFVVFSPALALMWLHGRLQK